MSMDKPLTYLKPPGDWPKRCYTCDEPMGSFNGEWRPSCECEQPARWDMRNGYSIEFGEPHPARTMNVGQAQQARTEFCDRCGFAHDPALTTWDERIEAHRAGECQACTPSHDYCYPTDSLVEPGHFECPNCSACPTWNKAHAEAAHRLVDGTTCGKAYEHDVYGGTRCEEPRGHEGYCYSKKSGFILTADEMLANPSDTITHLQHRERLLETTCGLVWMVFDRANYRSTALRSVVDDVKAATCPQCLSASALPVGGVGKAQEPPGCSHCQGHLIEGNLIEVSTGARYCSGRCFLTATR